MSKLHEKTQDNFERILEFEKIWSFCKLCVKGPRNLYTGDQVENTEEVAPLQKSYLLL